MKTLFVAAVLVIAGTAYAQENDLCGSAGGKSACLGPGGDKLTVVDFSVDDAPWRAKRRELEGQVAYQKTIVEDQQRKQQSAREFLERALVEGKERLAASNEAEVKWREAIEALSTYSPPGAAKTDAYLRADRERDRWSREAGRLFQAIDANLESGNIQPRGIFDDMARAEDNYTRAVSDLRRLDRTLGFAGERGRLAQAVEDALDTYRSARDEMYLAAGRVDVARKRFNELELAVQEAQERLSSLEQDLGRFSEGAIRIGGVRVSQDRIPYYEGTVWDPSEALRYIDDEIKLIGAVLRDVSGFRTESRKAFLDAQADATFAQDRVRNGIWRSAIAQGIAEEAFNAVDIVEKTIEFGPIGAIGEGGKKLVEAAIFGAPEFYEPTIAPGYLKNDYGELTSVMANLEAAVKYSRKRGEKSMSTGPLAKLGITRYIRTRNWKAYLRIIEEGGISAGRRSTDAFHAYQAARRAYQKALDQAVFRSFGQISKSTVTGVLKGVAKSSFAKNLAHSIARDTSKMVVKKALAEWLEGVPLAEYMAAEAKARVATRIFLAASTIYWDSRDPYEARVAERKEILAQYDPKNHMRIVHQQAFEKKAQLSIVLRDDQGRSLPSAGHKVTVKVGGKPAKPVAGSQLEYLVSADDLANNGKGGVALEVVIEE